jgi:hypothetical protein
VVGWGNPVNCDEAIDAARDNTLVLVNSDNPSVATSYMVPYVADLSIDDASTFTQTPIARPFYCTKLASGGFGEHGIHDWYFIRMPSTVTLSTDGVTTDTLYTPSNWVWQ